MNKFRHVIDDVVPAKDCAWPQCKIAIPKSRCMCEGHWKILPKELRSRIWNAYEMGQEEAPELVSEAYRVALARAVKFAEKYEELFSAPRPLRPQLPQ